MTSTPARVETIAPAALPAIRPRKRRLSAVKLRTWAGLYLLIAPTVIGTAVFTYYPNLDVFIRSLYRWQPAEVIQEFIGLKHFRDLIGDGRFWGSFQLALTLLAANLVKMWPSIFVAVLLHRLRSDRMRYLLQVLFVLPMVIPGMVWLLIWKNFLDPNVGIINRLLSLTGMMELLQWLDERMWRVADALYPLNAALDRLLSGRGPVSVEVLEAGVARPSGLGVWGLGFVGATLLLWAGGGVRAVARRWFLWLLVLTPAALIWQWHAVWILPLTYGVYRLLTRRTPLGADDAVVRWTGVGVVGVAVALVLLTRVWDHTTHAFESGAPAWLGHSDLLIPTLIFWGFPWVGTVGVLIYLSGLQQIGEHVYEAGEIDGLGSLGRFFHLELPLIMTQVRIMLIFMTIGTLTDYYQILLLLGPAGGPAGKGMVPGLYMYNQAFVEGRYGYACALGVVMFVLVLIITIVYQRYVKVEK